MASLLKDILLRHQRWEDEVDRQGRGPEFTAKADSTREQTPSNEFTQTQLSHNLSFSTQSLQLCHDEEDPASEQKECYCTRPSGLRSSSASVNGSHCLPTRPFTASALSSTITTNTSFGAPTSTASTSKTISTSAAAAAAAFPAVDSKSHSNVSTPSFRSGSDSAVASPTTPPTATTATFALPFAPYPVQQEMCATISSVLTSSTPHVVPVAVAEVPTGCGKTMALLSSVLRYQQELKRMAPKEAESVLTARRPLWQNTQTQRLRNSNPKKNNRKNKLSNARDSIGAGSKQSATSDKVNGNDNDDDSDRDTTEDGTDAGWGVPRSFFKHFRVDSRRKIRAELDVTGSQELRRRFLPPPCTIYYVTRTHAQLRQAVRELRRLHGAQRAIRMNILGSRERYCIHPKVVQAKANHTLPVEGNNLGEVCDKLVSMGLCEMVDKYDELSCSAIGGSIGHQRGLIWDMEDLVLEGSARTMCPYYAARDLVFFADINFCTYQYLLDPLIRHETKMEAALNNAIVVFDEAHNVSAVCQDALSLECSRSILDLILSELAPLVSNSRTLARHSAATSTSSLNSGEGHAEGFVTMQYPRELHLGCYTLVEIFSFLHTLFRSIGTYFDQVASSNSNSNNATAHTGDPLSSRGVKRPRNGGRDDREGQEDAYRQGSELERHLRCDMETFMRTLHQGTSKGAGSGSGAAATTSTASALASLHLFKRAYGVIMSLGVTFNPFLFSIFGLSMLKRWLLLLRFLFQRSRSFVLMARSTTPAEDEPPYAPANRGEASVIGVDFNEGPRQDSASFPTETTSRIIIEIRCLDGGLAFSHLLQSVHRVVLASGTLAPFTQLAQDLGLTAKQWRTVEGLHVVPPAQYRLTALTSLPSPTPTSSSTIPLRSNYASLSNPTFLKAVARCVVQLAQTVQRGGVLFFVPNYAVLHSLAKITRELLLVAVQERRLQFNESPIQLFLEPRKSESLTQVLHRFQCHTQGPCGGTALFFSVYRGKLSEGIDFTDDMARLVICLGVPLQPLKSWKVVAQRAYSGPEWYTTDAIRAVNQALGRCLRHVRDYGAVVLLDERYAQAEYQQRLSRWCRATMQTESSLTRLCEMLQTSFTQWRHELGTPWSASLSRTVAATMTAQDACDGDATTALNNTAAHVASKRDLEVKLQISDSQARSGGGAGTKGRLGTYPLPFQFVRRSPLHRTQHSTERASWDVTKIHTTESYRTTKTAVKDADTAAPPKAGEGLLQSSFACTAVKLLYETAHSTGDVSRHDLQAAIALLAENFAEDELENR